MSDPFVGQGTQARRRAQAGVAESVVETRRKGEIGGLKRRIEVLQGNMPRLWNNTYNGRVYTALGEAIEDGEEVLARMKELLAELQALEPENV